MGAFARREVARCRTLLRISVKMVAQLLGSSIAHSSDSGNISFALAPEVGIGNDPGMGRAGAFRTLACPMFRSIILATFEVSMRSVNFMGELARLFDILTEHGLHLKLSKSVFMQPQMDFLGVCINKDGVTINPAKITGIAECRDQTCANGY